MKTTITISIELCNDGWYTVCDVPGDNCVYRGGPHATAEDAKIAAGEMVQVVKESMGPLIKKISYSQVQP